MKTSTWPMNISTRLVRVLLIPLLLLGSVAANSAATTTAAVHPDVRVLIDISGSMKQNDPHNLRKPALELLLQLFPKDAKAGVWTFGETVESLAPLQNISEGWRKDARQKAVQITSTSLYTNIPAALEKAAADMQSPLPGYRTSIILLTDGVVDISKSSSENAAARQRLLNEILPRLRKAGVIVHTIALSKSADRELLDRIAAGTGGLSDTAETAAELNRIFLKAFDAAAPAEQVPLAGNHFLVDSSIDELTALVFTKNSKPVELVSPDRKRYSMASHGDDVKWFQGQGFELITVKKPFEGEWTLVADIDQGSRVTIVSNLNLAATRLSESLFVGGTDAELLAALKQKGEVVVQPEFLKLVNVAAIVQRREDKKQWQVDLSAANTAPSDGYFRAPLSMLNEAGNYDIAVNADGKTFQRSQRQAVTVRDNFDVRVAATDTLPPGHRVTLMAQNPRVDAAATKVKAQIKAADGKVSEQEVGASGDREWMLALDVGAQSGRIEVTFDVASKYQLGEAFTYRSATVALDQNGSQVVAPAAKPEVAAKAPAKEPAVAEPHKEQSNKEAPKKAEPEKAAEPAAAKPGWKKWALYGGLALGNLLIFGLGYFAYRMIMGGGKSKVLDEADDEDEAGDGAKGGGKDDKKPADKKEDAKAKRGGKGTLDLPDDAIDIDPSADKKKK